MSDLDIEAVKAEAVRAAAKDHAEIYALGGKHQQRDMAEKASLKTFQEDIIRMKQSQINNINDLEKERITQLENKMKVNGSFQILSILKLAD